MEGLFWLLLPVAAASGWYLARRSYGAPGKAGRSRLAPDYFKGLNYLLNEQPDKAIEIFIRLLKVDQGTLETHFALASLYRRRGEVDRAIRIHQNIIARPTLADDERLQATFELGQDYMKAGLLDRAEDLFHELVEAGSHVDASYRNLIDIYQQENDWDKAIETAESLARSSGKDTSRLIAQYCCEKAEMLRRHGQAEQAMECANRALEIDPGCVRASLIQGGLALEIGSPEAGIAAFKRVEQQDPDYLPEVIGPMLACYQEMGDVDDLASYLHTVLDRFGGITPMLMLAEMIKQRDGEDECMRFITRQLRKRPSVRGIDRLIDMALSRASGVARENLSILKDMTTRLLENRHVYRCIHCGFSGRTLHWQCPGCKQWTTVKPIQGVEGE